MKISRYFMVLATFVAAVAITAAPATDTFAAAQRPAKAKAFESSPGYEKLDLRLREAWSAKPTSRKTIECILKATDRMGEDDKAMLAAAGFNARTVIGKIATGNLKVRDVPEVANLRFIQVMELAVPLSLKKGN